MQRTGLLARCKRLLSAEYRACGIRPLAYGLTVQIMVAFTEGVGIALIVPVVGAIQGGGVVTLPILDVDVSYIVVLGAVVLTVACRAALQWLSAVQANRVRLKTTDYLRLHTLDALLNARWAYLERQRRSHLVQSLTTEIARSGGAVDQLRQSMIGLITLTATAAVAVFLDPLIGLAAIAAVTAVAVASIRDIKRASRLGSDLSVRVRAFGAVVTDSLASARLVRAHDAAEAWISALSREAAQSRDVQERYVRASAGIRAALTVASIIAVAALIVAGQLLDVEAATLLALVVALTRLTSGARALVQSLQTLANLAPAIDYVELVANESLGQREHPSQSPPIPLPPDPTRPIVRIDSVSVVYPRSKLLALNDVTFEIPHGAIVAIQGPSGAGKSTLLDVILGLREATTGAVEVDGRPLPADVLGWRARTAYVPQQVVLIPGSVRENLTWSLPKGLVVADDDLWRALDRSAVGDLVRALPKGLDTILGEESRLSGGENQRISLARALLRDPELLVLDEATSALDSDTEAKVVELLKRRGGSVLLVTHRPAVAAHADIVIQLRQGRVT